MKKALNFDRLALRDLAAWTALATLALGGCAGAGWLESPMEADLPLEAEVQPYPTALGTRLRPNSAHASVGDQEEPDSSEPAEPEIEVPRSAASLAVIPPHLRTLAKSPEPIPISVPPRMVTVPQAAALPATPSPKESSPAPETAPAAEAPAVASTAAAAPSTPIAEPEPSIDRAQGELIAALEADIRDRRSKNAEDEELPRLEQHLRLLYLAAGRMDDAVAGVESLDEPQREAFKHLMFGMGVWLSPDEARRAPLRSAKVLRSLREAAIDLSAASKLELSSPIFCERVDQFGWYSEFPRNEFRPKQQVILYVEVENFAAEKKGQSYETELQGSYQIFDAGGRIVAERQLPLDREVCRNYRRDYFLAYPMYLPESIEPGRYRLELTVEDLKASGNYQGRKFGEGMIEFTIRQ